MHHSTWFIIINTQVISHCQAIQSRVYGINVCKKTNVLYLYVGHGAKLVEQTEKPGGVELVNAHRSTKTATAYDIVELAAVVQRGDEGVHNAACNKLSVIADQIKYLQEQARLVRSALAYWVMILSYSTKYRDQASVTERPFSPLQKSPQISNGTFACLIIYVNMEMLIAQLNAIMTRIASVAHAVCKLIRPTIC